MKHSISKDKPIPTYQDLRYNYSAKLRQDKQPYMYLLASQLKLAKRGWI